MVQSADALTAVGRLSRSAVDADSIPIKFVNSTIVTILSLITEMFNTSLEKSTFLFLSTHA